MLDKFKAILTLPMRIGRGVYLSWAGAAVLLLSACALRWIGVPDSLASSIDPHTGELVMEFPIGITEWIYRLAFGFFAACFLLSFLVKKSPGRSARLCSIMLLGLLVTLPKVYYFMEPDGRANEAILYGQMERVIADIESNTHHQQISWRDFQQFSFNTKITSLIPDERLTGEAVSIFIPPEDIDLHLLTIHIIF